MLLTLASKSFLYGTLSFLTTKLVSKFPNSSSGLFAKQSTTARCALHLLDTSFLRHKQSSWEITLSIIGPVINFSYWLSAFYWRLFAWNPCWWIVNADRYAIRTSSVDKPARVAVESISRSGKRHRDVFLFTRARVELDSLSLSVYFSLSILFLRIEKTGFTRAGGLSLGEQRTIISVLRRRASCFCHSRHQTRW